MGPEEHRVKVCTVPLEGSCSRTNPENASTANLCCCGRMDGAAGSLYLGFSCSCSPNKVPPVQRLFFCGGRKPANALLFETIINDAVEARKFKSLFDFVMKEDLSLSVLIRKVS